MSITLTTLPIATAQQVFDQCVSHIAQQGKPCVDLLGKCAYRFVEDGVLRKCVAGCLIADSEYQRSFEGQNWRMLALQHKAIPMAHMDLIRDMQRAHDAMVGVVPWKSWHTEFTQIAKDHYLNTSTLDKVFTAA